MTEALLAALAVAALNVELSRGLGRQDGRLGSAWAWLQAAGFLVRFATLFGVATWVLRRRGRMAEAVVFLLSAAVLQLVGQVFWVLKGEGSGKT
ncbi:MAG: hypothetical protein HY551_07995 [Elusimicrobia bacterium]|nr:hypothetical protein [Elusimicrobiota bacterium]